MTQKGTYYTSVLVLRLGPGLKEESLPARSRATGVPPPHSRLADIGSVNADNQC